MLTSRIPEITVEIELIARETEDVGADAVMADAKARVPVRTGALRDAIHKDRQSDGVYVVAGDTEAFYGHMVEHGTSRTPPHPFLVPAVEENRATVEQYARARLRGL